MDIMDSIALLTFVEEDDLYYLKFDGLDDFIKNSLADINKCLIHSESETRFINAWKCSYNSFEYCKIEYESDGTFFDLFSDELFKESKFKINIFLKNEDISSIPFYASISIFPASQQKYNYLNEKLAKISKNETNCEHEISIENECVFIKIYDTCNWYKIPENSNLAESELLRKSLINI